MLVNYTYAATRKSSGGKVPVARRTTLLRARAVAAQALYKAGALLIHSHVAMWRANCLNALLSERKLWMYAAPGAKGKPLRWPVKRHFQALACKPGAGYLWNIFWHKRMLRCACISDAISVDSASCALNTPQQSLNASPRTSRLMAHTFCLDFGVPSTNKQSI